MDPPHPWTLEHFRKTRPEQVEYASDIISSEEEAKFKVVHAPVKSGKRSFPEIASLLNPTCVHIFVSSLNRKSEKLQHDELKRYGILVQLTYNKKTADSCIEIVMFLANAGQEVLIHLDELDYGCKNNQILSRVYFKLKDEDNVKFILYSATIDVVRTDFLDDDITGFVVLPPFVPAAAYYGVNQFIENKKIVQATSFVEFPEGKMVLSNQGKECLVNLLKDTYNPTKKQHIGILRLSGKQEGAQDFKLFEKNVNVVEEFAREYIANQVTMDDDHARKLATGIKVVFVSSKHNTVLWDDSAYWSRYLDATVPVLVVICQVAGRSTEWKCHPYLSWFHTCRAVSCSVSTQIQDQERVVYYDTDYNKGTDIVLYGNENCALYSAGLIDSEEMIERTNKMLAQTLNGRCLNSHKVIMKSHEVYDSWEEIPATVVSKLKLKKVDLIDERLRLRKQMYYTQHKINANLHHLVDVADYSWEDDGMYMTGIRGSVRSYLKLCYLKETGRPGKSSKYNRKLVWRKTDLLKNLSVGINKKNPLRLNVFYEDGETDPEKYKFMVREIDRKEPVMFKNDSMYNCSDG
jgi:hypothetical protein